MAMVCQYICDIVEIIVSSSGVGPTLFEVQESSFVGFFCAQESWFLLIAKVLFQLLNPAFTEHVW
jgi:hypothetical protein